MSLNVKDFSIEHCLRMFTALYNKARTGTIFLMVVSLVPVLVHFASPSRCFTIVRRLLLHAFLSEAHFYPFLRSFRTFSGLCHWRCHLVGTDLPTTVIQSLVLCLLARAPDLFSTVQGHVNHKPHHPDHAAFSIFFHLLNLFVITT